MKIQRKKKEIEKEGRKPEEDVDEGKEESNQESEDRKEEERKPEEDVNEEKEERNKEE